MVVIQCSKKILQQRLRRLHRQRVQDWKEKGGQGYKPKMYEVADDVVAKGLEHFEAQTGQAMSQ